MDDRENQTYEVQVFNNGRWQVHARYTAFERAIAIQEGRELGDGYAVRVILEDYNPDAGRHTESLVFRNKVKPHKSPKARAKANTSWADMSVSSDGRVGYALNDMDEIFEDYEPQGRRRTKVNFTMFLTIWLTVLTVGVGSGGASAILLALLVRGFKVTLAPGPYQIMLSAMFVIVFLMAASSTLNYYRVRYDLNPFKKKKKPTLEIKKTALSRQMEKAAVEIDKIGPATTPPAEQPVEPTVNIFEQNEADDVDELATPVEKQGEVREQNTRNLSEEAESLKAFLIAFLGSTLSALKASDSHLHSINKFCLHLFMSGAVVRLCEENRIEDDETDFIHIRILETLGTKTEQAERFALDFEKHLHKPANQTLFEEAGQIALRMYGGDQAAALTIAETIENWQNSRKPEGEDLNPNLLSIMFTDMVGSTDLATKHGDYAAQEVLKAHDLIVRSALTNYDGKEIKHLGDGIMASFKRHEDAMEAAVEIHKRIEGNNKAGPEFPLHVRIGINAGEPIKKNNDLFGTAVQLAARLCSLPGSDCIYISSYMRDLFGDQPVFTFIDQGLTPLKGFEDPQQVYLVDWTAEPLEYPEEAEETVEKTDEKAPDETTQGTGISPSPKGGLSAQKTLPVNETAPDDEASEPKKPNTP